MSRKRDYNLRQLSWESGIVLNHSKKYNYGLLFGIVKQIKKGKDIDEVIIDTGKGDGKLRTIICETQDTRKQVSTLKCGVWCQVLVYIPQFKWGVKSQMVNKALAFWSAYVPNKFDRVELEDEQNQQRMVELLDETEEKELKEDFLVQFERKIKSEQD